MRVAIFAPPGWTLPADFSVEKEDVLDFLTANLNALPNTVANKVPDVLLVVAHEESAGLLQTLEKVILQNPALTVLLLQPLPDPKFLVRLMQIGVRELLTGSPSEWQQALQRARSRMQQQTRTAGSESAQLLGFMSAKGGNGCTCTAVNVAAAAAQNSSERVLFVDLSLPFGDADVYLTQKANTHNLADFCNDVQRLDDALLSSMVTPVQDNLHLIASPSSLEQVIGIKSENVERLLDFLRLRYSNIVVDLGTGVDPLSLRLWSRLDKAVICTTGTVPSLRRLGRIQTLWHELGLDAAKLQIVLNHHGADMQVELVQIKQLQPDKPIHQIPVDTALLRHCVIKGEPAVNLEPRSRYARSINDLTLHLLGRSLTRKSIWQRLKRN